MTEWSWRIDDGLLLWGARPDSFSAWLFFLTPLAKGLLCALAAGSAGVAGQLSGQLNYPFPHQPLLSGSLCESRRNIVHVRDAGKRSSEQTINFIF